MTVDVCRALRLLARCGRAIPRPRKIDSPERARNVTRFTPDHSQAPLASLAPMSAAAATCAASHRLPPRNTLGHLSVAHVRSVLEQLTKISPASNEGDTPMS